MLSEYTKNGDLIYLEVVKCVEIYFEINGIFLPDINHPNNKNMLDNP